MAVAEANAMAYRKNVDTYIEKLPEMTAVENKMRMQYMPQQRQLERQLSALDQLAAVQSGLEAERTYGPQRSLETLRRQYELSPQGYALQRGLGAQLTRQFEQLYGRSPYASVEPQVAFGPQSPAASYYGTIGTNVARPEMET
jgi:hypothetical protein